MTTTLSTELAISLSLLHTKLVKRLDQQLSVHGISFSEYVVMYHLYGAPNKTMRRIDLAECVGLSASGVTRLLVPMEKIHLTQRVRNQRDARVSLVKLSDTGERLFLDASVTFQHAADAFLQPLTANQIARFLSFTKVLL